MEYTKAMQKNIVKKPLFMCFKPHATDDSDKPSRRLKGKTTDPVLTYLAVADEEGVVLPALLSSAFAAAEDGGEESENRRKKKGRDRWQALRAALKETLLMKKIRSRRKTNKNNLSRSNSNLKGEAGGKISNPQSKNTHTTNSSGSSTFGCSPALVTSSSSVSSSSSSRTDHASGSSSHDIYSPRPSLPLNGIGVTKQKQYDVQEDRKKIYYGSNIAVCMLLISLMVLILWGKFFAILYTSMWFYLVPPGRRRPYNEGALCGESDQFDSVEYKKKIIMEGLLERSHSRVFLTSSSVSRS